MRIVIQRVSEASVSIKGTLKSSIQQGFLILLGIGEDDSEDDIGERFKICVFDSFHAFQGFQELLFGF